MEAEEYKRRFMARVIEKIDDGDTPRETLGEIASSEYEGMRDMVDLEDNPDPECDADESLSYWAD